MDTMQKVRRILDDVDGMSQQQLADLLGVSQPTVNRWVNKGIKRMLAEHRDAVEKLYEKLFGTSDNGPLPSFLTARLTKLPEQKKTKMLNILENMLELAESQD